MKVRVKEPFESKKIRGKVIPPGIYDINPEWAGELIREGIAEELEPTGGAYQFKPEFETRVEEVPETRAKPKKRKKKDLEQ